MKPIAKQLMLKNLLESSRKSILKKKRNCLHPGCQEYAIGSHVLQQRFILASIVDKANTFYSIKTIGLFDMSHDKHFTVVKVNITSGYKFLGFCSRHDNDLFQEIETHPIDLHNRRTQALFSYRTLCLELRKQQHYLETCQSILSAWEITEPKKKHYVDCLPPQLAIKDLEFYKQELEDELLNGVKNYDYYTVELPEKKVCFSASVTVTDPTNPLTSDYDEYGRTRMEPIVGTIRTLSPLFTKGFHVIGLKTQFVIYRTTATSIKSLATF